MFQIHNLIYQQKRIHSIGHYIQNGLDILYGAIKSTKDANKKKNNFHVDWYGNFGHRNKQTHFDGKFQLVCLAEKPVYHINVDRTLTRIVVAVDVCFFFLLCLFRIFVWAKPINKSLQQSNKLYVPPMIFREKKEKKNRTLTNKRIEKKKEQIQKKKKKKYLLTHKEQKRQRRNVCTHRTQWAVK